MIRERLTQYEQRTGDSLALNVLAKIATTTGILGFVDALASNAGPEKGIVATALLVGGVALDKATGGLRPYGRS